MHIGVFASERKQDEFRLIEALRMWPGVRVSVLTKPQASAITTSAGPLNADYDLYCIIGVKHAKRMRALNRLNEPFLFWDKGYNREWPWWWRVAYCSNQPTDYLMSKEFDPIRAKNQGWLKFKPWVTRRNGTVLFAGASNKYSVYSGLPEPDVYASEVLRSVSQFTKRRFVYRPKPSYSEARPIDGADFSRERFFASDLNEASVMVTHGSGACLDALLAGVPSVVLGDGVTRDISSTSLVDIERPRLASDVERRQLLCSLAHFQWNLDEIAKGDPWSTIKGLVY